MSEQKMPEQCRRMCFTLNNYSEKEVDDLIEFFEVNADITDVIMAKEVGEGGTPHIQGYFGSTKKVRFTVLKKLSPRTHWIVAKGDAATNLVYCSKGENIVFKRGTFLPDQQGKRSDIALVKELISRKERPSRLELYNCVSSYQAYKFAEIGLGLRANVVRERPTVFWFYGPTGTGKSHVAHELAPGAFNVSPPGADKGTWWFCGYDGHEDVIVDDFRPEWCSFAYLLKILDKYPLTVPNKGGGTHWLAKRIFITCPVHPKDAYHYGEDKEQLLRRITEIREFTTRYVERDEPARAE